MFHKWRQMFVSLNLCLDNEHNHMLQRNRDCKHLTLKTAKINEGHTTNTDFFTRAEHRFGLMRADRLGPRTIPWSYYRLR